jgi:hypothetical protein
MVNPVALLYRSFYDRSLARIYVREGHGIGLTVLFVLSLLIAVVYAVRTVFYVAAVTPETFTQITANLPEIHIQNGEIVAPKNFFQRIQVGDDVHVTLDTTNNPSLIKDASPNEIYISNDAVQFIKGQKVELMPLKQLLGKDNVVITQENVNEFLNDAADESAIILPSFVFLLAVPVMFLKYVVLTYFMALFSYIVTFFSGPEMPFEERMRLAVLAVLPAFVFNLVIGAVLGQYFLGFGLGVLISLFYLFFYLGGVRREAA